MSHRSWKFCVCSHYYWPFFLKCMSSNISKLLALSGLHFNPKKLILIKVKVISCNTITCCNTAGSASRTVSPLSPSLDARCMHRNPVRLTHHAEHPRVHQVWVILDQFIILVRPWNSSSLVLTSSLGSTARGCHSETAISFFLSKWISFGSYL